VTEILKGLLTSISKKSASRHVPSGPQAAINRVEYCRFTAIARAVLRNAPILILDEPTSGLDAAAEHMVINALERAAAGRTTFIIAHRLSTVRLADRIVVLDGAGIAEAGTHAELLARNGRYAHLYQLQVSPHQPAVFTPENPLT